MVAITTLCPQLSVAFFGTVDMIHYTLYITAAQYCPVPLLVAISSTWYTLWRKCIIRTQWQRGGTPDSTDRVDGLHE